MASLSIIGHIGENSDQMSGQIIKTKTVLKALREKYGEDYIKTFDTKGGIKTLFRAKSMVDNAFLDSKNIIMLPAQNALRIFAPLIALKKKHMPLVKTHYIVIGGWLPKFIEHRSYLKRALKSFDCIYVETTTMKKALEEHNLLNVEVMPNCKELNIISEDELFYTPSLPLRLCTFSRVMKNKGIEDAVNAVNEINKALKKTVYTLDIYGQVEPGEEEWFNNLKSTFTPNIKHLGEAPFSESVNIIKNYYALLFPTRFYTEGIPGTIIDAFAAGVPVISAKWESFADLIDENVTGYGYEFGDYEGFLAILKSLAQSPERIFALKKNCIIKAKSYLPCVALEPLTGKLDE